MNLLGPLLLIRFYEFLVLTCWCAFHCNNIQTIDVPDRKWNSLDSRSVIRSELKFNAKKKRMC